MSIDAKVSSTDLLEWGENRVNLSSADAQTYRAQGDNLKVRLEQYIDQHPAFSLVKMLNHGSVAKGTALRTISDMDVAVYVEQDSAPTSDLVGWLRDRLREAYGGVLPPDRITADEAAVRISFSGTEVDVECIAILYAGDADDYGDLILRSGKRVRTSVRKHLEFVRKRKTRNPRHYAQLLRFIKYWRNTRAQEGAFPLSAFAMELIATHVVDAGTSPRDYPQALQDIFSYIVRSGLNEAIIFTDNYSANTVPAFTDAVRIIDPVAAANNVASGCSTGDRSVIVDAAHDSLDDIVMARSATTKDIAIASWRSLFGPEFNI